MHNQQMSSDYSCSWTTSDSLFPLFSSPIKPITDEEFNAFHTIDRELYSKLIFSHGREAGEAMQVMAFWLWLEKERYCPIKLVFNISRDLPPYLITQLANETVLCLRCIENHDYFMFVGGGEEEIPLLQSLMEEKRRLSLHQLHADRKGVLSKVTTIANKICVRAFKDILQPFFGASTHVIKNPNHDEATMSSSSNKFSPTNTTFRPSILGIPCYLNPNTNVVGYEGGPAHFLPNDNHIGVRGPGLNAAAVIGMPSHMVVASPPRPLGNYGGLQEIHIEEIVNREMEEMRGHIHMSACHRGEQVPPDDRTIFLTFSKGYPISESEVRDFFTRKFGNFIEAIHMQEVAADEQALYARVVACSASLIDFVVPRDSKAKFSINGKHVWARKYVKKNPPLSGPHH